MYLTVRIREKETSQLIDFPVHLPDDIRLNDDVISDFVSDYLDDMGVPYKWYRVLSNTENKIG